MRLLALLCLALLLSCRQPVALAPGRFTVPDTIYTASGAVPVILVDSIPGAPPGATTVGRYDFTSRRLLISRQVTDSVSRRKVVEHERCHRILAESGLAMHFLEAGWLVELLCDAWASAAINQLERGKP